MRNRYKTVLTLFMMAGGFLFCGKMLNGPAVIAESANVVKSAGATETAALDMVETVKTETAVAALPEATDKLTICVEEWVLTETGLLPVIEKYQEMFPEVELEIRPLTAVRVWTSEYEIPRQAEVDTIKTEVMSGGGPDLFLLDVGKTSYTGNTENLFEDLEKNARAGIFCDLGELIEADETMDLADFYPFVESAGTIDGSMVVFPTSFWGYTGVTTEKNLAATGFSVERAESSMDAFHEEVENCLTEEQRPGIYVSYYQCLSYPLLDYDTGEVHIGEAEKNYFEWSREEEQRSNAFLDKGYTDEETAQLTVNGELPVVTGGLSSQFGVVSDAEIMAGLGEEAVFFMIPDEKGEGVVRIESYAAINDNSRNKRNAWEFLKLLLSEEMQMQGYCSDTNSLPVRRGEEILKSVLRVGMGAVEMGPYAAGRKELSDRSVSSLAQVLERTTIGRLQQIYYLPINGEMTFEDYYDQYSEGTITYEEFSDIVTEGLTFYWEE